MFTPYCVYDATCMLYAMSTMFVETGKNIKLLKHVVFISFLAQSVLLSEYVFKFDKVINNSSQKLTTELCYPKGFHWNKSAKVYIILPG